jgi:CheY-like chemotaxis protein
MSSRGSSISASPTASAPSQRRILVVEDSPVVAPFAVDVLEELGFTVVGPAPNLAVARELIEEGGFDLALVDVFIRGERVFPLCDMLEANGVPFILTSGYGDWQLPEKLEDRPRLQKPYTIEQVKQALDALIGSAGD